MENSVNSNSISGALSLRETHKGGITEELIKIITVINWE